MDRAADFFVSYISSDRAWAEWIAWQLEAEGYQVVIQAWDFRPGRDFVQQMHQVVEEAQRTVAVLSPAYLGSAFGGAEWRAVFAKDPTGEHGLLLPVRVEEVEPPGLLKTRIYVDLVDRDATSARAALLAAARGARGKPAKEPEFPGAQRQAVGAAQAPRFPAELPPVWNVPYHPNPFFTGRDQLLTDMHARLTAAELAVRRAVLTGLGGVGKTQAAVEYAYRQRADYDLVWWVRAEQSATLLADYAALAGQSLLAADLKLAKDAPQEVAAAVRAWLERHHRWLLLFDNADEPQAVAELLPRSGTGHVLVTSRAETGWEQLANPLPVEVLAPIDAAAFLLSRTKQQGPEAQTAATTLASSLGGLPLALEQAAAYITVAGTVNLTDYAQLFATRAMELLNRGQPLGYQHTVATTWYLALQTLLETEPAAVRLLTLTAFMAPDDLPQSLLAAQHSLLPGSLAATAGDPLALADATAALRRYSLMRVVGDGLFVHQLLQTVVRTLLDADLERAVASVAIRVLNAAFPYPSNDTRNWAECERLIPHLLAAAEHGERLDVETEERMQMLNEAGAYLTSRGQYAAAESLLERAMIGFEQTLGEHHRQTLGSMNNLAAARVNLGRTQEAHDLLQRAVAASRQAVGDEDSLTLSITNSLAETLTALGDPEGARTLHEHVLAARRRVLGDDHPHTLTSMNNLAGVLGAIGDPQGARDLYEQVIAAFRRVLGEDHPNTLMSMNNLAEARRELGDLKGARQLHEQTLTGHRRLLGEDHPSTLMSMDNLALTLRALGDSQGARDLHEQTLAARRRVLGNDHPDTLVSMSNLAETRRSLGDLQGARELLEQALAGFRQALGDDYRNTMRSMKHLAEVHRELGEL
jgi:hypothetical protein